MVRSAMSEYFLPELRETIAEVLLFLNLPLYFLNLVNIIMSCTAKNIFLPFFAKLYMDDFCSCLFQTMEYSYGHLHILIWMGSPRSHTFESLTHEAHECEAGSRDIQISCCRLWKICNVRNTDISCKYVYLLLCPDPKIQHATNG
jgi:hypothetical protein